MKPVGLLRYIGRRTIYTVILLFFIALFNYFLFQILPGYIICSKGIPFNTCVENLYLPESLPRGAAGYAAVLAERAIIAKEYGFGQVPIVRIADYLYNMFTFNFGYHIGTSEHGLVMATILQRAPYTILLIGSSTVAGFGIGIGIGVVAAAKRGKLLDVSFLSTLLFLNSLPVFFLGALLELIQVYVTGNGYSDVGTTTLLKTGFAFDAGVLQSFFLPFVTLTLANLGGVFLTQRAVMIDTVAEDYILMARAKGVPERTVMYKHAFRNAVLPIFTAFAISVGFILSGAVITETVFHFPGLGLYLYNGILADDYPLEQAMFFIISLMVLICIFIADLTYGLLDPRVRNI